MAKKELGFVELEWQCPVCNTRNPGSRTTCAGCGAPQPDDVKFATPVQAELIKDEEALARAEAGPDIHCAYCGARNAADATQCHQCGADLSEGEARSTGEVLGAHETAPVADIPCATCGALNSPTAMVCVKCGAPMQKPKAHTSPAPSKQKAAKGCSPKLLIGIFVLLAVAMIGFMLLSSRTKEVVGTAKEASWTRSIAIEGLVPTQMTAWRDEVPSNATLGACRQEVRRTQDEPAPGALEVCGTPYTVDTGTGYGQVVQDCKYQIVDDRCTYTVLVWSEIDVRKLTGSGFDPEWPGLQLVGQQRQGKRTETFTCELTANDETYYYRPKSLEQYKACVPGSKWLLDINTFGTLVSAEPR